MDYTFKMLRNDNPVESKAVAISLLNTYPYHLIGQPLAIRYWKDEDHTATDVILAIGIKNYNDVEDNDSPTYGEDFYSIIGDADGVVKWQEYSNGNLESTDSIFVVAQMTPEEFEEWVSVGSQDNVVTFVHKPESDTGRIYKGDTYYGTTDLLDLKTSEPIEINGEIVASGANITNIANTIINNSGINWHIL